MLTRRDFFRKSGLLTTGLLMGGCTLNLRASQSVSDSWLMPDEGDPHTRTWMAFGASVSIWGRRLLPEVRRNLAAVANTIAKYEPVTMLVRKYEYDLAREMVGHNVELAICPLDDLWIRDTGSIFVVNEAGEKAAVNFNFNGWGEKQRHAFDAKVADLVAKLADVEVLLTDLVMEGGCIEVDGHGTTIITESCTLNENRNPGVSKARFEDLMMPLLGINKIIWLPGIKGRDITDGHTDFYARFARQAVVLAGYEPDQNSYDHEVTLQHLELLRAATDAHGRKLQVNVLEGPIDVRKDYLTDEFAPGYIGYYLCNGAVIMQEFGDKKADAAARVTLQEAYPDRTIEMIAVDGIAAGGGSIHCTTQQEPAFLRSF